MVRLRNREIPVTKNNKNGATDDEYDPLRLYHRYIHNLQITPKPKDSSASTTAKGPKKYSHQQTPKMMRPTPGLGGTLDTKRSKIASQVRSKPSVDIQSSRSKMRPKTASSKRKPVENLEEYCISPEKKVTFEADEIECFFDALKETVEEVVQVGVKKYSKVYSCFPIRIEIKTNGKFSPCDPFKTFEGPLAGETSYRIFTPNRYSTQPRSKPVNRWFVS